MKNFLKQNKTFLAIVIGSLIIGGAIYFSLDKKNSNVSSGDNFAKNKEGECVEVPDLPDKAEKLVTKIIDGDTFVIDGGYSVRILSIDADERGYPCYQEAKDRLEELILNKEVKLEMGVEDVDQYCRYLRYVFLSSYANASEDEFAFAEATAGKGDKDIGLELVKEGLAVARFYSDFKYQEEITEAERQAREDKIGCKWSSYASAEASADESAFTNATEDESSSIKTNNFQWEKSTAELTGLEIIDASEAKKYLGEEIIVQGKIIDAYCSKTNTVFLNFGSAYPKQCFVAVIFNSDQDKFVKNPEKYYLNKTVRIKGKISEYKGKPQIILKDPEQIEAGK